jgi:hypothetical protein
MFSDPQWNASYGLSFLDVATYVVLLDGVAGNTNAVRRFQSSVIEYNLRTILVVDVIFLCYWIDILVYPKCLLASDKEHLL